MAIFSATTNTYSPYLVMSADAYDSSHDQVFNGQPYQEVLTNFPFGSQILTGVFLNVTLSGLQGTAETYQGTLLDRIGYAARQGLASPQISLPPGDAPAFTDYDIFTLNVLSGLNNPEPNAPLARSFSRTLQLAQLNQDNGLAQRANPLLTNMSVAVTRMATDNFLTASQANTGGSLKAPLTSSRISTGRSLVLSSIQFTTNSATNQTTGHAWQST